jgi:hypothetical protein
LCTLIRIKQIISKGYKGYMFVACLLLKPEDKGMNKWVKAFLDTG